MSVPSFPDLTLANWRPTCDTLQGYAQVLSAVRVSLAPREKHWGHVSLHVTAAGLTTGPMAAGAGVCELTLDLLDHRVLIVTNGGERMRLSLGQSPAAFCDQVLAALADLNIKPTIDRTPFAAMSSSAYDQAAVARYWQLLPAVDGVLRRLRGEHRGESGAVQFWPHHFDVALLLFTGRRVPGVDPADEESADENMNFGFLPGDDGIPEPYFYATAYPTPAGISSAPLPAGAYWHTEGWTGAVLPYAKLRVQPQPAERLLAFFRAARDAGFTRMQ